MSYDPITERMPTEVTKKSAPKGGEVPQITEGKGGQTTGYQTETGNGADREKGSEVGGVSKRSYSDEPQPAGRGRRIHDGVTTGPGIIKKGG